MANAWRVYQEEAAAFFVSLGLEASTDTKVQGVRTSHDIDVLVKSRHIGFEITWLVECKHWQTPVSKLHVLALREIVADVGADRGIMLAENGYQSGAFEAAKLTNVQLTSLAEFSVTAQDEICGMQLLDLFDRTEECSIRYWDIPKPKRIEHGLRPDTASDIFEYSGARLVEVCKDILTSAFRSIYPLKSEEIGVDLFPELAKTFASPHEVLAAVEPMIDDFERRLTHSL